MQNAGVTNTQSIFVLACPSVSDPSHSFPLLQSLIFILVPFPQVTEQSTIVVHSVQKSAEEEDSKEVVAEVVSKSERDTSMRPVWKLVLREAFWQKV